MSDFSATFHVNTMKSGNPVVYLLREQFDIFASSARRADACEGIARSLQELGQFREAGSWYEAVGRLAFAREELRLEVRSLHALDEYERALECYAQAGDEEAEADCSRVTSTLRKACAPA